MELEFLLSQYEWLHNKLNELEAKLDELLKQIPHVQQLLAMKGIGRDTIAGFLAEVGDISQYRHPKQISKLAGLNLKTNYLVLIQDRPRLQREAENAFAPCSLE